MIRVETRDGKMSVSLSDDSVIMPKVTNEFLREFVQWMYQKEIQVNEANVAAFFKAYPREEEAVINALSQMIAVTRKFIEGMI
jgi:hypothetical protein